MTVHLEDFLLKLEGNSPKKVGIVFCSPEGVKDMGYLGNVPIVADYPGPTDEAMVHLDKVLDPLGLTL